MAADGDMVTGMNREPRRSSARRPEGPRLDGERPSAGLNASPGIDNSAERRAWSTADQSPRDGVARAGERIQSDPNAEGRTGCAGKEKGIRMKGMGSFADGSDPTTLGSQVRYGQGERPPHGLAQDPARRSRGLAGVPRPHPGQGNWQFTTDDAPR